MLTRYYRKYKKDFKRRLVKGIKIFLKKKNEKKRQYASERYRNFSEN